VAEIVLDGPGILAIVCQLVAIGMPQHVAVHEERESGRLKLAGGGRYRPSGGKPPQKPVGRAGRPPGRLWRPCGPSGSCRPYRSASRPLARSDTPVDGWRACELLHLLTLARRK
jgi:hypothetical protein